MFRLILAFAFVGLCAAFPPSASAQSLADAQPAPSQAERIAELEADLAATEQLLLQVDAELAQFRSEQQSGAIEAAQAQNAAIVNQKAYENSLRGHALSIFTWQLVSSYVVLLLVVAVTGLGVVLSFMEVKNAMKAPDKVIDALSRADFGPAGDGGDTDVPAPPSNGTTLVVSAQKLQVTSAITGVVILVLSLAFLYLFVKEVLEAVPIDFASGLAPETQQDAGQTDGQ